MRWMRGGIMLGCLLLTTNLFAADLDNTNIFRKVDDKINRELNDDKWHYFSRAFARLMWDDYKLAHENTKPALAKTRIQGKLPDIQNYDQYVGAYTRDKKKAPSKAYIEVKKSGKGTFFVDLAGTSYPAIATYNSIMFTTGVVGYSPALPQLTARPYCILKMYSIALIDGKYFLFSPDAPPSEWLEISRITKK